MKNPSKIKLLQNMRPPPEGIVTFSHPQ